jgi:hypothetical protein
MESLNTVLQYDNLINKNASLNRQKVAWWLGMPHTSGGKYFYDLLELSNGTLTSISAGSHLEDLAALLESDWAAMVITYQLMMMLDSKLPLMILLYRDGFI